MMRPAGTQCVKGRRKAIAFLSALPIAFSTSAYPAKASTAEPLQSLGIIMVGASWCPFCKGAAVQLYRAASEWGWPVLIASLDNRPIPPFTEFIPSQGHPLTRDVLRLPTTLIVAPDQDQIIAAFEGYSGPMPFLSRIATALSGAEEGFQNG